MRVLFSTLPLLFFCAVLSGCGGGNGSGGSSAPLSMAGSWQFTAKSSFGQTASAVGTIAQNGENLSGQFTLSGTPCATSATMAGTISGSNLNIGLNENNQIVSFVGVLAADGNSASGTYSAPAGGCTNGDVGSWSGQRTSASGQFVGELAASSRLPIGLILNLRDDGGKVSGSGLFSHSVCFHKTVELSGTTVGNMIQLTGEDPEAGIISLSGELNHNQLQMTISSQITASACQGESGNGTLARIK
jgi:hypothetical protein